MFFLSIWVKNSLTATKNYSNLVSADGERQVASKHRPVHKVVRVRGSISDDVCKSNSSAFHYMVRREDLA